MKTLTFIFFAVLPLILALNSRKDFKIALPVQNANNELEFVFKFTRHLHQIKHFSTFITFGVKRRFLHQFLMADLKVPVINWGMDRSTTFRNIDSKNLIFIKIASVEDPILTIVSKTMEGFHFMNMLFVFDGLDGKHPTQTEIRTFFQWCWHENIINVALTFRVMNRVWNENTKTMSMHIRSEVFNYSPFPKFTIFNFTSKVNSGYGENFIVGRIRNVYGYMFCSPMFTDTPTVFLTSYERHRHHGNGPFVTGTAGLMFHEYVHFVNGTLNLNETHHDVGFYRYHKETLLLASRKAIDIGIHPYSGLLPYANQTAGSYPIGITNACIIVPMTPEIEHGQYLFRALQPIIWLALCLELVSLFVMQCFYLRRFDFGNALVYAFRTLLYQPFDRNDFGRRSVIMRMIHLLIVMLSVLVNSCFVASLTSLLSTTIMGDQVTNVEEFLESGLQIMVNHYEKEIYFDANLFSNRLISRLYLVNESVLMEHKEVLNTSFAYVVHKQEWIKINFQQQLLWKPKFRIASPKYLCTTNHFLKFPLQWDSPFSKSIQLFLSFVHENGLNIKWERASIYQAIRMKLLHIWHVDNMTQASLAMSHCSRAVKFFFGMMLVSIICFLAEIVWFHKENLKNKLNMQKVITKINTPV